MGGGAGGGGGMGGGVGGGGAARNLVTMISKLDLVTQGVRIELNGEQLASLAALIADLDETSEISDDEARARLDEIEKLISDDQKKVLESIDLPRPRGGSMMAAVASGGARQGPTQNTNPFSQEENAGRLKNLRERLKPATREP